MDYCTACGRQLGEDWAFCRQCGKALEGLGEPAQAVPPQEWRHPHVSTPASGLEPPDIIAAVLLLVGVGLGVAGLFPPFFHGGQSLASNNSNLVANLINFAGWATAAILVLFRRTGIAAWLAAGVTASTLGFYLLDTGYVARYGAHVAAGGFWRGQANWVFCAVGTGVALYAARQRGTLGGFGLGPVVLPLMAAAAGIAAAVAYVPGWERYRLFVPSTGRTVSAANPNAFHNPGPVIAGHVVVLAVLVAAPILATLLRPGVGAAAALAGLVIPQVGSVFSGLVTAFSPADPAAEGITSQQVATAKAVFTVRPTPWLWAEAVAVGLLILVLVARVLTLSNTKG